MITGINKKLRSFLLSLINECKTAYCVSLPIKCPFLDDLSVSHVFYISSIRIIYDFNRTFAFYFPKSFCSKLGFWVPYTIRRRGITISSLYWSLDHRSNTLQRLNQGVVDVYREHSGTLVTQPYIYTPFA